MSLAFREHRFDPDLASQFMWRLDSLRGTYASGSLLAVSEALDICRKNGIPLPDWTVEAASRLVVERIIGQRTCGRGRARGPIARAQEDLVAFARWDTVKSLIEHRRSSWKEYQETLRRPNLTAEVRRRLEEDKPSNPGKNLEETFEAAADSLTGTRASGSAATVKNNYKRVERAFRDPKQAMRYHLLSPETYIQFGIDPLVSQKPRTEKKATFRS